MPEQVKVPLVEAVRALRRVGADSPSSSSAQDAETEENSL
jgi:hypothetical protein